jgi:hypothetical protein
MTEVDNEASRNYKILVYGIDKKSLILPSNEIVARNFKLVFEPYKTQERFDEYDGVILFQGIFESFKGVSDYMGYTHQRLTYDKDELDKRTKELGVLLKQGGFISFILCDPIYDHVEGHDVSSTDLAKICLNSHSLHRDNFRNRVPGIRSRQNEFHKFIERFGAANTYFDCYDKDFDMKVIAVAANDQAVGIILRSRLFFVPALRVENNPDRISEYFQLLAEAVTSAFNKLLVEIPEWVKRFKFGHEDGLLSQRTELIKEVEKPHAQLEELQQYKSVLIFDSDQLVDATVNLLTAGFGFKVNSRDDYREDFQILGDNELPVVFGEIKGTNKGVQREYINQADSHRERAGLSPDFPTVLFINTHIKNARTIEEKDQDVPAEQVRHAKNNKILILRTLDLLGLLKHKMNGKCTNDQVLQLFKEKVGWLKVTEDGWVD